MDNLVIYVALLILASVLLSALLSLGGAALGGYLVYRTKRESFDSLFNLRGPQGEAWNDDPYDNPPPPGAAAVDYNFHREEIIPPEMPIPPINDRIDKRIREQYDRFDAVIAGVGDRPNA